MSYHRCLFVYVAQSYRVLLHEYCQKHGGNIQKCDYIKDHSSNQPKFQCTITCMVHGTKITRDSDTYFPRKDEAKESAAFNAYSALVAYKGLIDSGGGGGGGGVGDRQSVQSHASVEVSWVSRLKEHYDKQGQPGMKLDFKEEEIEVQGFVSSVFVPELGREVKGEVAKSKKEARQSAAKRALQHLDEHK